MATSQINRIVEHLRQTALARDGASLSDGQLLEGFILRREEAAFEMLVRRHGPMVLGVCRRVLGNHHDAEDAFQATFLVLVRKAASVKPRELVGNWLYGVAFQTAVRARALAARRGVREKQMTALPEPATLPSELWSDLQPLLDRELSLLGDKYRVPIVLCDLEGKTRKEVAEQLGVPEGTINSRLARARTMLAQRLSKKGVTLSAGALASALTQTASANVPAMLVGATVKAGSGAVSAQVALLAEGVLKAMLLTKLKTMTLMFALASFLLGAGWLFHSELAAGPRGVPNPETPKKADEKTADALQGRRRVVSVKEPAPKRDVDALKRERKQLEGTWRLASIQADGEKISGKGVEEAIRTKMKWLAANEGRKLNWTPFFEPRMQLFVTFDSEGKWKQYTEGDASFTYMNCEGTSAIEPAKKPKTIDLTVTRSNNIHVVANEREEKGALKRGIYDTVDDTLQICWAEPGKDRPADFAAKAQSGQVVWVLERVRKAPPEEPKEKPR